MLGNDKIHGSKASWQFACACTSLAACGIWLLLNQFAADLASKTKPFVCGFLVLWWFFGAYICTNWGPHTHSYGL